MSQASPSNNNPDQQRSRGRQKYRGRRVDHRRGVSNLSFEELRSYFSACSRCGYFFTSYRVIHGVEALDKAGRAMSNGWLDLVWNRRTRDLLRDIYDLRTDIAAIHFESSCRECQRRIIYDRQEEEQIPVASQEPPP